MSNFRYILQPYKGINTRYECPQCEVKRSFTRYIDTTTNEHLATHVGKCNRENNCGYHYPPKQYFDDNEVFNVQSNANLNERKGEPPKLISYIPPELVNKSINSNKNNNFIMYLKSKFGDNVTNHLIDTYNIGTSKHWDGATVFWQIDIQGNVRTGKIMLYDENNGKRIKQPYNYITWVHCVLKLLDFNLKQCFFGEHLLELSTKPIAIVESEKTAIIASVYLPEFVWLAVGSISNLTMEKCLVLKNRKVVLFPDLKAYEKWSKIANSFSSFTSFKLSDYLECNASDKDKEQGLDIADYLIQYEIKHFNAY